MFSTDTKIGKKYWAGRDRGATSRLGGGGGEGGGGGAPLVTRYCWGGAQNTFSY